MKTTTLLLSLIVAGTSGTGCASYMRETRQVQAREAHERMTVSSDVAMLKERLKGIESAQEQIAQDIMDLKQLVSKGSSASAELDSKLAQAIKALEARDERLQKETIQVLSKQIAEIINTQVSTSHSYSGTGLEHVVEPGQTLSAIAQAYGVTVSAIVKANKLANPDSVRAGQKLFIPR